MEINRKVCVGYKGKNSCKKLTVKECIGVCCSFFATTEQARLSAEKSNVVLRKLPAEKQAYIAGKYYGGTMPWQVAEEEREERKAYDSQRILKPCI